LGSSFRAPPALLTNLVIAGGVEVARDLLEAKVVDSRLPTATIDFVEATGSDANSDGYHVLRLV
jgi:hypothetical protein